MWPSYWGMTHFTGVIILRKRNTTVLVPMWSESVERSHPRRFLKIHENNQYRNIER